MASTKNSLDEEKIFVETFNKDKDFRATINSLLGNNFVNCEKVPNSFPTSGWVEYYGKERSSPAKSDFAFTDSKGNVKVGASFKNVNGRATSSKFEETRSIFYSTLNGHSEYANNNSLRNAIDNLFDTWEPKSQVLTTPVDVTTNAQKSGNCQHEQLQDYIDMTDVLTSMVKDAHDKYPDFMVDVMKECLVGQHKFGDTIQKADIYIQKNREGQYETVPTSSPDFTEIVDSYLRTSKGESKLNIRMKSSSKKANGKKVGRNHWIRFL
jgi:hypothetical protein|tara:strand:+ start:1040 stop:1840 length:801 start_codon:yes stop_codon:yes gene_type:complete